MPSPLELATFATDDDALHAAENSELLPWHLYAIEESGMVILATGAGSFNYCAMWQGNAQFDNLIGNKIISSGDVEAAGVVKILSTRVVGPRGAAVADPAGGSVVDVQARAQLSALLARIRAATGHGLIA